MDSANADTPGSPLRPGNAPAGTSVLIAGPPLTRKRDVMFDLLASGTDRSAAVVTTKQSAARVMEAFSRRVDTEDWRLNIVDCVSRQRAVGPVNETATTRYVTSAGDLTGIGIELSGIMQDYYHDPAVDDAWFGLHSLSTLLMYASIRRVYQFVHVIAGRIDSSGFRSAFTLDTVAGDREPVLRLSQLFDAIIEVRHEGEHPELRVRGVDIGPSEWTAF